MTITCVYLYICVTRDGMEEGEIKEEEDDRNKKKVPLSLEELLAKKKAEEDALSKVTDCSQHGVVVECPITVLEMMVFELKLHRDLVFHKPHIRHKYWL